MPADERHLDERMAGVREVLAPETFAAAREEGHRTPVRDAVQLALGIAQRASGSPGRSASRLGG
jgi:hypothetical protein